MPRQTTKEFYYDNLADALEACQNEGYKAMFMPELADARIQGKAKWGRYYSTPSIRATGKTNQGNAVVVYAHIPNLFSNPANIRKAVQQGLFDGAGRMPQEEFQRLVDAEDNERVFLVDYDKLKNSKYGRVSVDSALEHPQTIPFLGGQERAERYLAKFKEAYGRDSIGIWHSDDLNKYSPLARLLFAGNSDGYNLNGGSDLDFSGRFLEVCRKVKTKTLDNMLK